MANRNRMLIVEHEPKVAQALESAGARLHFSSDVATDGWDAIEKLQSNEYDVVCVDLDAPQSSGYGVLTWMKEEYGHDLSRLLLLTPGNSDAVRKRIHEENCQFVEKTDSVERLASVLYGMPPVSK